MPRASLGDLLRACGQNPTLAEVSDLEASVGADCIAPPPVLDDLSRRRLGPRGVAMPAPPYSHSTHY